MTFTTETTIRLLDAVFRAHHQSAFRDNPSSVAFKLAFQSSDSFTQALIAALSTLGGVHAPLAQTYDLLNHKTPADAAYRIIKAGRKVPGWGTSFKDDEIWKPVETVLRDDFPERWETLQSVTRVLHEFGKAVEPNPSAYTAITAIELGLQKELAVWIFISGRLDAWASLTKGN